ncbi:MAG: hypothetical protein ACRD1N_07180, partial [Terriglobia bacterium]
GFNWIVTAGALAAFWILNAAPGRSRFFASEKLAGFAQVDPRFRGGDMDRHSRESGNPGFSCKEGSQRLTASLLCMTRSKMFAARFGGFAFLALGIIVAYIVMLSLVGGAILPRYVLPALPAFYVLGAALILRLPRPAARAICAAAAVCFVAAWFINPPYPFPYEDNLAYADFIQLHQRAAKFLEEIPGDPVILTAWPATDELRQPFLGYVERPLHVRGVRDFTAFRDPPDFSVLYLYSRKWEPPDNLFNRLGPLRVPLEKFFDYRPAISPAALAAAYHLKLIREFTRRGQWVRIYARGVGP